MPARRRASNPLEAKKPLPTHGRLTYTSSMDHIDEIIEEARAYALTHNEALSDTILYGGRDEEVHKLIDRAMLDRLLPGIDDSFADVVADYVHAARAFHPGIVVLTGKFTTEEKQRHEEKVASQKKDYEAARQAYEERKSLLLPLQRQIIERVVQRPPQAPYGRL